MRMANTEPAQFLRNSKNFIPWLLKFFYFECEINFNSLAISPSIFCTIRQNKKAKLLVRFFHFFMHFLSDWNKSIGGEASWICHRDYLINFEVNTKSVQSNKSKAFSDLCVCFK